MSLPRIHAELLAAVVADNWRGVNPNRADLRRAGVNVQPLNELMRRKLIVDAPNTGGSSYRLVVTAAGIKALGWGES